MKSVIKLLVLLVVACKPAGGNESRRDSADFEQASVTTLASEFPANKLDELAEPVTQTELENVIKNGESGKWKRTKFNEATGEIRITHKENKDNIVNFTAYTGNSHHAMLGVQQKNGLSAITEVWNYDYKLDAEQPERWHQKLLSDFKLESFFDEHVILPKPYQNMSAKNFLEVEMKPRSIIIQFDKWAFMRELDSKFTVAEGPLNPALVKYKYVLSWDSEDFREQKLLEAGYKDVLTFTSKIIEREQGDPGIREFDCGHGVTVTASSVLPRQGQYNFSANNVKDTINAWSEGVEGEGVGEWIEFTISGNYVIGDVWNFGNGYNRTKEVWTQHNRVKKMHVFVDDKLVGVVVLANVATYQTFNIAPSWLKERPEFRKGTRIRFVIDETYRGVKYNNTSIFYFVPVGNCG